MSIRNILIPINIDKLYCAILKYLSAAKKQARKNRKTNEEAEPLRVLSRRKLKNKLLL